MGKWTIMGQRMFFSILALSVFCLGCAKDNIDDPKIRAEREKKIGFTFPASVTWTKSEYRVGMDDLWRCQFTIPLSDIDTLFPPSEIVWSNQNPFKYPVSDMPWFIPHKVSKCRSFEKKIKGTSQNSTLRVLINEDHLSDMLSPSEKYTVFLEWFEN